MKHVSRWTAGDGGAYSPSHRGAGQVLKKTGRDRLTPSTAVRLQDGRTAPLRTLPRTELAIRLRANAAVRLSVLIMGRGA